MSLGFIAQFEKTILTRLKIIFGEFEDSYLQRRGCCIDKKFLVDDEWSLLV